MKIERIKAFLDSCPDNFDFPLGGEMRIAMDSELELVGSLQDPVNIEYMLGDEMRQTIDLDAAYNLAIFALRMAVYAVRNRDIRILEAGLWGLFADNDLLDWRDVLVSLSIVEDCTSKLGVDFNSMTERYIERATERRRRTVVDGYLSRTPEMRNVETMGYKAVWSEDRDLRYVRYS